VIAWAVLAVLAILLAVWGAREARDATGFFAASRRAGSILAGLGGTAAGLSAFVFIGGPSLFATMGAASLWIILSAPLTGALQCWAVGEPLVDLARTHGCLTIPDIVAAKFGDGLPRGMAAAAVAAGGIAMLAVQAKGVGVLGEVLIHVPGWQAATALFAATTLYTAAGGMRAGLVAEAAQGLVMAVAAVAISVAALWRVGGPAAAVRTISHLRPELLDAWGAPGTVSALSLFLLFGLGTCAQPHYLQKFLLLKDSRSLRWMPLVMTAALGAVLTVWVGLGVGATALWADGTLHLTSPDQLAPAFLSAAGGALLGLAVVAIAAAVMSTAATLMNLVAAALVRDFPLAVGRSPAPSLGPARVATVTVCAAALLLAFHTETTVGLLGILGWGTFTAALLPVILLGLNWPGATRRGAIAALAIGPLTQLALELQHAGQRMLGWEPGLTGAAVGTLALVALSLGRKPDDSEVGGEVGWVD